jgi:phosphoribosyl 1,2-cyclic phosphodiesterase
VVTLALRADVKHLFVFHHDPDHDDAKIDQILAHARQIVAAAKSSMLVEAAVEGRVVELVKSKG